jgi:hypothetical protein
MKNLNEVVIGTKVTGNWGAMIAIDEGVVVSIIKSVSGVSVPPVAVVQWDDMGEAKYTMSDLKSALEGGMEIGIYIGER